MNSKKWNLFVLIGTSAILLLLAAVTALIDPFLHFHKPLNFLEYPLKDERYQNDGIARHYDYDAIITGTSMTQNFKVSQLNELMNVTAIKTSYSGASFHELAQSIDRALGYRSDTKLVLCSLDGSRILYPADKDEYEGYPDYLYNKNPFDDVKYLLNKDVIPKTIAVLNYTRAGELTPTMDTYGSWHQYMTYGKDIVLQSVAPLPEISEEVILSDTDLQMAYANIENNFLKLAMEHETTDFYFFIPPYSIVYWEALHNTKQLNAQMTLEKMAVEILLQAENVHIYSFSHRIDWIENLNNYTDSLHYSADINSEILKCIAAGESELTKDNYVKYFESVKKLYEEYDYSRIRN